MHPRTFILVFLIFLFPFVISNCSKAENVNDPVIVEDNWKYGSTNTHSSPAAANGTVYDAATGVTLRFPNGGSGTVSITKVLETPDPAANGSCVKIEYSGVEPVYIEIDTSGGTLASVLGFGFVNGCFDDEFGNSERWVSFPAIETFSSTKSFELLFPGLVMKSTSENIGFDHYWIKKITPTTLEIDQRSYVRLQVSTFVDQLINTLPASLKSNVNTRRTTTHKYRVDNDGDYYSGFWWRSLGSYGRLIKPTIHLKIPSNVGTIAHETSHYFTHILTSDDFQSDLEGQASLFSGHGIRDEVGRDVVLEEYAYFGEYLLMGTGGQYDLEEPYVIFRGLSPLNTDFPGLEGFGAVLLAQLVRTKTQIRDLITGSNVDIPVIGMSHGEAFEIISKAAPGIEQLRRNIETKVGADKNKLDVVLQRSGWRYSIQGVLVDENDAPIQGATFSNIIKVGDTEYKGGFTTNPSASDGSFSIIGDVFPGNSILRVTLGGEETDIDITIDYSKSTNQVVDIGSVSMEGLLAKLKKTTKLYAAVHDGIPHTWSWYRSDNGQSGSYINKEYTWRFSGGYDLAGPKVTWTDNSFSFNYSGTHDEDFFEYYSWSAPGTAEWIKEFTGTVDKSGKLLTANLKLIRATSSGEVTEVEIVLNNIELGGISAAGAPIAFSWTLKKDNVLNHLQIVKCTTIRSPQTTTYVSSDWENGVSPYWGTPVETVFYIQLAQ